MSGLLVPPGLSFPASEASFFRGPTFAWACCKCVADSSALTKPMCWFVQQRAVPWNPAVYQHVHHCIISINIIHVSIYSSILSIQSLSDMSSACFGKKCQTHSGNKEHHTRLPNIFRLEGKVPTSWLRFSSPWRWKTLGTWGRHVLFTSVPDACCETPARPAETSLLDPWWLVSFHDVQTSRRE